MTDDPRLPLTPDDLAAYALDANEPEDAATVAAHLEAVPAARRQERGYRAAAGELAAAVIDDVPPPAGLRARVLDEARRHRAPAAVVAGASPIEVHRIELARAVLLLRDLAPEEWARPVDPPEFAGWTVHDVAVHLAANETLLADHLGVPVAGIPELATDNEGRTAEAQGRHRHLPPEAAVAELEEAAEAVLAAVVARGEDHLDEQIDWWGTPTAIGIALLVRTFETWTHADDIRRAVGRELAAPPRASLLTMAHAACGFVPGMLAASGDGRPGRLARFRFTDLDDAAWDVDLGVVGGVRPGGDGLVDVEIVTEAVAFCRAASARLAAHELDRRVEGDEALAAAVVDALPALAVL